MADNHGTLHSARESSIREAHRRHRLIRLYQTLIAAGTKPCDAAGLLKAAGERCSRSALDRWSIAFDASGFDGLIDGRVRSGRKRTVMRLTDREAQLVRARVLVTTNRTSESGSVPEALRQAAARGEIRTEVAEEFAERDRDGRGVPDALRRDLGVSASAVRQLRGPTEAGLDYLCAPGSLMWVRDQGATEDRFIRVGDVLEADDATVNFHVAVPWEIGGCPCSERYGVKVARFQWLVAIDRASRFIPGWSYTMRPRDSYRAEDILSLFHGLFRQHGIWSRLCLERGSWEAGLVESMIEGLGIERLTAYTPHQKAFVEGLFSQLWTKLAILPGQVGRHQGEEEKTDAVVRSCQRGATDPRTSFPMLSDVLAALHRVTAERNAQAIHSDNYGSWVPQERWLSQLADSRNKHRMRSLEPSSAWLFSPCVREWTVQGGLVGGSIQIMDGLSVRVDFAAEWLPQFAGYKVRAHFDPSAPSADATLVLLENCGDHRAGEVLGMAYQVNKTTRYARHVLGWGEDPDLGRDMRKIQAAALRREVRTILPGGDTGLSVTDLRDGLGRSATVEASVPSVSSVPSRETAPAPVTRRSVNPFAASTPDEFARRRAKTAALLAASQTPDE